MKSDKMPKVMQNVNKLANIIRRNGKISFVMLSIKANMSPSSLYKYIPYLKELFHDIVYDEAEKVFKVVKSESE